VGVLVDTNVLLRRAQPGHPHNDVAIESIALLLDRAEPVHFTPQNVSEFWNVATRPCANNGLGLSVELVAREIEDIERVMTLLPDTPAIYVEWKRLVAAHEVRGVKVHDARLVAAMNAHGVRRILTFNVDDFTRFNVAAIHPADVCRPAQF
jgi:predicted nucleic acid-binding protein